MSRAPRESNNDMNPEYDFAYGVRGKFYRKDAVLVPPIHLEADVLKYLQARASARDKTLSALVNELLKKDIELIEVVR